MKEANISYNELRGIIENLEGRGLLKTETTFSGKYYQSTEAGLRLLDDYRSVKTRLFPG